MKKKLYLFIEGEWDKIFFEVFLRDYLQKEYDFEAIELLEFSENLDSRAKLRTLAEQHHINFLLCPDLDGRYDDLKRIAKIRKLAIEEFKVTFEMVKHKSFVIVQEIESWYLAGFKQSFCDKKQIKFYQNTEDTNKTTFKEIAKQLKKRPMQLRDELITTYRSHFSIQEAQIRNESFRKFLQKVEAQLKRLS
ncbi:MAG: hypothetical protein RIS64_2720 [Bacteroidota bacterium]|jgi:hypothetical protein